MNKQTQYPRTGLVGWLSILKWEGMREVDRRNEGRVNLLAMLWALSLIGAAASVKFLEIAAPWRWLFAAAPVAFGFLALKAYLKLLRDADEMLRQIHFEAMAAGFGTGLIVGMTVLLIDLPAHWVSPAIIAPMCFAFTIRVILAARDVAHDAAASEEEER